jgi:REP element-mobilizing transposase RayT
MCRGDQREPIFATDADREVFLVTLGEGCEQTGWRVHAYVLMPNHYHCLLETPTGNLVAGMRRLQSTYTRRFNGRNKLCGHLFQGRYKALVIEAEKPEYFRGVSDYIHLNPARAGWLDSQTPDLAAFPWSSFPVYAGRVAGPEWLETSRVLGSHGCAASKAGQRAYTDYMRGRVAEELGLNPKELARQWGRIRRGWYLGGEEFKERLLGRVAAMTAGKKRASFTGEAVRAHDERMAEQLLKAGLVALGMTLSEARSLRQNDWRKQGLAWLLRSSTVVSADWVIRKLALGHPSNVSRAMRAFQAGQGNAAAKIRRKLQACKDTGM